MRANLFILLGLSCVVAPVAAQTVIVPSAQNSPTASRDKIAREANAESRIAAKMRDINDISGEGLEAVPFDTRVRFVRGTPFLVQSWAMGDVQIENAPKPTAAILKFDVFNQQLRALRPQGDSIVLAPEKIKGFTLRPTGPDGKTMERHFERLPITLVPETEEAFAEDLSMGKELRLLKFQQKKIVKGQAAMAYGSNSATDSYQSSTQYYLRWADGTYMVVKANKASILSAVASRQAAAVAAEAQDKTKVRSDAELGAMVQRIETRLATK
jgi:hypothetical protein